MHVRIKDDQQNCYRVTMYIPCTNAHNRQVFSLIFRAWAIGDRIPREIGIQQRTFR